MTALPVCLTREAYTYAPQHRFDVGWRLFDVLDWPNIQRLDETGGFVSDQEAAFHVVCAGAFDPGREGEACRDALRHIVRFGEQGLNPIATMLASRAADPADKQTAVLKEALLALNTAKRFRVRGTDSYAIAARIEAVLSARNGGR